MANDRLARARQLRQRKANAFRQVKLRAPQTTAHHGAGVSRFREDPVERRGRQKSGAQALVAGPSHSLIKTTQVFFLFSARCV